MDGLTNPPSTPMVLMNAMPPAAAVAWRNEDGIAQKIDNADHRKQVVRLMLTSPIHRWSTATVATASETELASIKPATYVLRAPCRSDLRARLIIVTAAAAYGIAE